MHLLKRYTIRHVILTSVNTLLVKCCTHKCLLPSKTLPRMLNLIKLGNLHPPPPSPPFIFEEELIKYQYNFIRSKVKRCWRHLFYCNVISFFACRKCQKKVKNWWKSLILKEKILIFWTSSGISIKFLGKMWLMITWKVTKNLKNIVSKKNAGEEGGQIDSPSLFRVESMNNQFGRIW